MLVEIAIGDAYGRPFEFNTPEFIKGNNDLEYCVRDKKDKKSLGMYTDDTQQTIAVVEYMLENDDVVEPMKFIEYLQNAYWRDPRGGYSKSMKAILEMEVTPEYAWSLFKSKATNGCVMRTVPIGLYSTPEEVKYNAGILAFATHKSSEGIIASQAIALTAHYYYYRLDGDKSRTYEDWMREQMGKMYNVVRYDYDGFEDFSQPVTNQALNTASYCIKALHLTEGHLASLLKRCIGSGGDVDSTASICMGIGSVMDSERDLPFALYDGLENGKYGRDYLRQLEAELFNKFPR